MKAKEVKNILGVTQQTLHNYVKNGLLTPFKVNDTHYEYDEEQVMALIGGKANKPRFNVTYARVSQPKQRNDLKAQSERLYDFCIGKGIELKEQIEDVKSGMEFDNRKGFQKLLDMVLQNQVDNVVVENKDRLVRFGFNLLKNVFRRHGTNIIVMSDIDNKTYEQELTDDLISIIHYYSMKSYSNRRKLNAVKRMLEEKD